MTDELKPCPFCGGTPSDAGHIRYGKPLTDTTWADGTPIIEAFYVNCMQCGAVAKSGFVSGFQTKAEAVTRWNTRAIEREAATEARHAAELREQAERFSEVVTDWFGRYSAEVPPQFQPFIIPAPDPVSEWLAECSDGRVSDHTMTMLRLFHNWLSEKETRKIGEAGE